MKAASAILTTVQRPMTMLGLPPQLFALTASAGAVSFGLLIVLDLFAVALIGAVLAIAGAWAFFYVRARADWHFANVLFVAPRFWRAKRRRFLAAGGE